MDTEVEDPELIFELPDHVGDCQCACDNVVYGPGYTTTCLQVGHFFCPAEFEQSRVEYCPTAPVVV